MDDTLPELCLASPQRITARPNDYLWMAWEGESCYVLFDRATGLTHLINEFPAVILTTLAHRSLALAQLADELADLCGENSDEHWRQAVAVSVNGLATLGVLDVDPQC